MHRLSRRPHLHHTVHTQKSGLSEVIPPLPEAPSHPQLKRIQIRSELLSEFWGRDVFVKATALLPKGYEEHPDVHYPVLYWQGHHFEDPPFGFPRNRRFEAAWNSADFPRMIVVTFQHPTPYYDDSYFIDSANCGPWGTAFVEEVLPAVEAAVRIQQEPYARVLSGGSTGGWVSAAHQIYYPELFGGAWSFCPDPLDFRELISVDIYNDENAFQLEGHTWGAPEKYFSRTPKGQPLMTVREMSRLSLVLGTKGRSAEVLDLWNALFSPVGEDGSPRPIWDHETGVIDREVAHYWRDNGYDLRHYLETNWAELGPLLVGKLHFATGDMDHFFLNQGVYRMERFLEQTQAPAYGGSFNYGRPNVGHGTMYGYRPYPMALLEEMADTMEAAWPNSEAGVPWRYN